MGFILGGIVLNGSLTSAVQNSSRNTKQNNVPLNSPMEVCIDVIYNYTSESPDTDPNDNVSEDVVTYAQKFQLTALLVLFLIGAPCNVINMAVFCRQGLKDRVNLCLFSLSLTDALFLISSLCLNGENIYLLLSGEAMKAHWNAYMVNKNFICFLGTGFISFCLSAIIACERCMCVISPLKYQTWLRTRTMAVIICSVYSVVFGLHFLVAYKYRVGCFNDPETGVAVTALVEGKFYKAHRELIDRLDGIVFGLGISGGMMIVVITATIITTVKLRQIMTWRTETSSSLSSRDVALTKMLIGSSVFFIICASPACLFRVVWFFLPEMSAGGEHHNFYLSTLWILEGFCYINYSFNFFIYYVMGSRYRDTFWALCGSGVKQRNSKN